MREIIFLNETSLLFGKKDVYYNYDRFKDRKIKLCFITGYSGSGKSTLGRELANRLDAEYCDLDRVIKNWYWDDDEALSRAAGVIRGFFKGPGKKFRYPTKQSYIDAYGKDQHPLSDAFAKPLVDAFIKYAQQYTTLHKDKQCILEGVYIYMYYNDRPDVFKNYAVIIKGASQIKSNFQASRRDSKRKNKGSLGVIKQFTTHAKYYLRDAKNINKFYNYFEKKDNSDQKLLDEN